MMRADITRAGRNVLVSSASHKAPLVRAVMDALGDLQPRAHVIAGDLDPDAPTRHVAGAFWRMPALDRDSLPTVIDECRRRGIGVILPTRDGELMFWARHAPDLARAGIAVAVSNERAVERCLDKLQFARFGRTNALPVIDAVATPDFTSAVSWVVKERFGAGAAGIGLDLSEVRARRHADTLQVPLYQPHIAGPEISVDGWLDRHGVCAGVVLRRRDRVVSGESRITTTFRDERLEQEAMHVLETLDLRGPVILQAILVDGRMHIIECNARFGGASTAAIAVGLDTIRWSLLEAFGHAEPPRFNRAPRDIRQVRLPADLVLPEPDPDPESGEVHHCGILGDTGR